MVDFGGWDMPVQYPAGTIEEHLRTRTHAGLFDVSHMGEIDVRGPDAIAFVNKITSNDVTKLVDGQAQYTALTTPQGTVVDDLLVYRLAAEHFPLVGNASHIREEYAHIAEHIKPAGDAVAFTGDVAHSYTNPGTQQARFSLAVFEPGVKAGFRSEHVDA